jgi:protocatechuate 3,4-dioxygenase beta subunit
MRRAASISILFLALQSAQGLPQQTAALGVIEGTVVRSNTGEPIKGAQVTLTSVAVLPALPAGGVIVGVFTGTALADANAAAAAQNATTVPGGLPSVTTGADGKFSFKDLSAGTYRIAATADGFVRQEYGQRTTNAPGRPIFLGSGQSLKDAAFRLTEAGTISGRVLDEAGQPATGASVQLLRSASSPQGKNYQPVGTGTADDRGDYRIYGVPPGRYYLVAGTTGLLGLRGNPNLGSRFSVVYYPNAENLDRASTVEVKSGSESSFSMRVSRQTKMYRVRGRVVDPSGAPFAPNTNVMLGYVTFNAGGTFNSGRTFDPATGNFELLNVVPGDYTVTVRVEPTAGPRAVGGGIVGTQAEQASRPSAWAPIRVVNADVDGVLLTLTPGVPITGRLVVEGQPISSIPNLDRLRLGIVTPSLARLVGQHPPPLALPFAADGTFQVLGMKEGEYRIQMSLPGYFLKSVTYGGEDILNKPFKFSGSGSEKLEVTLHAGAPQLGGTVTDAKSQPVAGIPVYLVPGNRSRTDLFRSTLTDQSGRFTLANLSPGEYKVFSWEAADNNAHFDPDFVKQYEQEGKTVQVAESSNPAIDVKLIPAQ